MAKSTTTKKGNGTKMNKIEMIEFQIHEAERMAKSFIRKGQYAALDRINNQINELQDELDQIRNGANQND
jgi:septation ring formation regulator EzrA